MSRKGKGLRVASGGVVLLNIVIFFLPVVKYEPLNYQVERFSQLDYMLKVFSQEAPYEMPPSIGRFFWMLFLILLPIVLSLVAGIWGMVGNDRQIVSSILIFVVLGLYILLILSIGGYFPEKEYSRDIAGIVNLLCSITAGILALITLLYKGEQFDEQVMVQIPQIQEIKQEQIEARYSIITEAEKKKTSGQQVVTVPPYVQGAPRGIMVGLTGIYAGAEISFQDGECIRLGRLADNDLVFEGQDKVSRNHCYIKWNGKEQKFMIKDSSSNGTFVDGSEDCLPQNIEIEIPIGSVIAIGDEKNTFRLE